jgi:uncharacterized membrane protein
MKIPVTKLALALCLATLGVALATAGIYVGEADDAPGAALLGLLLMVGLVAIAVKIVWRKPSRHPEQT